MSETSTQPDGRGGSTAKEMRLRVQKRSLSSSEQAAILMLSMGDEISAGVLKHFSREEIVSISQAMARLSNVKQPMVSDVIGRFFEDYKEQSSIKGASRAAGVGQRDAVHAAGGRARAGIRHRARRDPLA